MNPWITMLIAWKKRRRSGTYSWSLISKEAETIVQRPTTPRLRIQGTALHVDIVHELRRTAVRNLERAGVPRSVAMQITGHKTESVYRRYAIVSERDVAEGLERLGAFLRS